MIIEILAVGDELVKGKIVNTNSSYLASLLEEKGYGISSQRILLDSPHQLEKGLKEALLEADLVIATGGLGSTFDDRTLPIAAKIFDCPLVQNEQIALDLKNRFPDKDLSSQAKVPEKAEFFLNKTGTAPGIVLSSQGKTLILLPGVPLEMKIMAKDQLLPFLSQKYPLKIKIPLTKKIGVFQIPEMDIDPTVKELLTKNPDVQAGIYPFFGGEMVHFISSNEKALKNCEENFCQKFSSYIYTKSGLSIPEALMQVLIESKETLAVGESCTGGAIASSLTLLPGASTFFLGSIVSYSNEMKKNVLQVQQKTLDVYGAVSKETVKEMLDGVFSLVNTDYALCVSGIAGPSGGTEQKPVGTVCVGIAKRGEKPDIGFIYSHGFHQREAVITYTVNVALGMLIQRITSIETFFKK
jgi:nicotinamide-nucleotide amidase